MRRIDELHMDHPFAGSRSARATCSNRKSTRSAAKHVRMLMNKMGIEAPYRKPSTSKRHAARPICVDAVREAIARYGCPDIFNTDQGCQFTSIEFTGLLKAHGIKISMDGRGSGVTTSLSSGCGKA